jgi:hypothetical protein
VLVNFREDPAFVKRVARERGYVAPVLLDQSGDVAGKSYGVWGPPTAYLIDARGQLIGRIVGARDWSGAAARRLVESLLPGSPTR